MRNVYGLLLLLGVIASCVLLMAGATPVRGQEKESRKGPAVTIDGLKSRVPSDWVEEKTTKPFRQKQFRLPAVRDDKENAEAIVFFFGAGGGGKLEDNIKRWKAQFIPPKGKTIDDVTKVEKKKINGVAATFFDTRGTYLFKERPSDTETTPRPNYRLINVYFESAKGPYFIRMVGPADTVDYYKKGFDEWIGDFK